MQNIDIKITGPMGSGKSTVAAIIDRTLKEYGYVVSVQDGEFDVDEAKIVAEYSKHLDRVGMGRATSRATVSIDSAT